MTRASRLLLLIAANWVFWIVNGYLTWNHLIPERFTIVQVFISTIFALPCGCCWLPFMIAAQLHDTGWPLMVYGGLTFANSTAWAWIVDRLWGWWAGRRQPRGFPLDTPGGGGPPAE